MKGVREDLNFFYVECVSCGARVAGYSRWELREALKDEGWSSVESWNGLDWVVRYYCPFCSDGGDLEDFL